MLDHCGWHEEKIKGWPPQSGPQSSSGATTWPDVFASCGAVSRLVSDLGPARSAPQVTREARLNQAVLMKVARRLSDVADGALHQS